MTNILLVEDDKYDAKQILKVLESDGLNVYSETAKDMPSFISLVCNKPWDIIVADYNLENISIEGIINLLKTYNSSMPIVVISNAMLADEEKNIDHPHVTRDRLNRIIPVIHHELDRVQTYEEFIKSWAKAIELKDKHTEGHSIRVSKMSVDLARKLGLCELDVTNIRRGSYLHDIGKILIDDEILLKPGKLTTVEYIRMQQHPQIAYDLLEPLKFMKKAIEIPFGHHERWDGSGYPLGLRKEDIPISARIFSVVDNYDAMTTDRPYRKALSSEFTLTFISLQAGYMFDPGVVKTFIEMIKGSEI